MYRRHIRMAQSQALEAGDGFKSKFLKQVASIPAVIIACSVASETYKSIKASNKLLNFSLTSAERLALYVTCQAKPVAEKYEPQFKAVDLFAYNNLKRLESLIPLVIRQPEYIVRGASNVYREMVESGLNKYEEVKQISLLTVRDVTSFGMQKSVEFLHSPNVQLLILALESTFDAYEMYLDQLLPPLGDEGPEQVFGDRNKQPIWERADILTNRFKERLFKHTLLRLQNIHIRLKLTLTRLQQAKLSDCIAFIGPSHRKTYEHILEVLINLRELIKFMLTLFNLRDTSEAELQNHIEV